MMLFGRFSLRGSSCLWTCSFSSPLKRERESFNSTVYSTRIRSHTRSLSLIRVLLCGYFFLAASGVSAHWALRSNVPSPLSSRKVCRYSSVHGPILEFCMFTDEGNRERWSWNGGWSPWKGPPFDPGLWWPLDKEE